MAIKNNQIEIPFTQADKDKLDSVTAGAEPQPAIASQAEAEAGTDNSKQMTPLRVLQSIAANAGSGGSGASISGTYLNNSGSTLAALSLVSQNSSGTLIPVTPNSNSIVNGLVGLLTAPTIQGATGTVVFAGLVTNVTTSFVLGDVIYLNSDGTLTTSVPDYGVNAFVAGYFVVKVGKITKNSSNPANKDFLVKVEILGRL